MMVFAQILGNTINEWIQLAIAAFAGGAFGAALGALPVFIFTGFLVIAGEAANLGLADSGAIGDPAALGAAGLTGNVAFGPVFGPHTSFAGGAAAVAYAAKKGYVETGFDYHEAKNIPYALGTKPDVLAVGGLFGILGMLITNVSVQLGAPWDPIAMGVTLSALFHRLILGYSIIGTVRSSGMFDMSPFERGETRGAAADGGEAATDGGTVESNRLVVEPWLPHQYKWGGVATLGITVGLLAAWIGLITGSYFLAFGISAATLVFLNCGVEQTPVTHHISLPAATAAIVVTQSGSAPLAGMGLTGALIVGGAFGLLGALLGEVHQRIFYAHSDTHWDPPAASIVATTFVIAVLAMVGVFPEAGWVPLP